MVCCLLGDHLSVVVAVAVVVIVVPVFAFMLILTGFMAWIAADQFVMKDVKALLGATERAVRVWNNCGVPRGTPVRYPECVKR